MSAQTRPRPEHPPQRPRSEPSASDYWDARPSLAGPGRAPHRGRGLFARAAIPAGALIERACTVEIGADQTETLDAMHPIGDFYFEHPENERAGLMAFGLMSLLNHAETPNADVRFSHDPIAGWLIDLVALAPIAAGEEITYRYKCPLWFDAD